MERSPQAGPYNKIWQRLLGQLDRKKKHYIEFDLTTQPTSFFYLLPIDQSLLNYVENW